jgi:hypothetical protein
MPLAFSSKVRIPVDVSGEVVTFICRKPTGKETSQFLNKRFVTERNKVKSRLYDARQDFANSIIVDVENATYENAAGEVLPINAQTVLSEEDKRYCSGILGEPVETWKDLIPLNWKVAVAMHFEDAPEGEEPGN